MTDDRRSGVSFGDLLDDLEDEEYPMSHDQLLETFGDREVTYADGSETVRELIGPLEGETYQSPEAVEQQLLNMVGDGAVGREEYTDRGAQSHDADPETQSHDGDLDDESL